MPGRSLNLCIAVGCPLLKKKFAYIAGQKCFKYYYCGADGKRRVTKGYRGIGWCSPLVPVGCMYILEQEMLNEEGDLPQG